MNLKLGTYLEVIFYADFKYGTENSEQRLLEAKLVTSLSQKQ